ncbi:MAG TPA: carboxypeptidase regulatory-like domain-containing protein [Bryobacteraceae bacterium]
MNVRHLFEPACLGMVLAVCSLAQPPLPAQPFPAEPLPAQPGVVSGTVVNTAGVPLRRVIIQLTQLGPGPGPPPDAPTANSVTETDSQGNFTFDDVAPGRYFLAAQRAGYLNASYQNARGRVLTLQPGQKTADIVIKMTPQGIVAGRVIDEENEPLPGATVNIRPYLLSKDQTVIPTNPMGEGKTDADGAFAIGGLAPARYVVSVTAPPDTGFQATSPSRGQQEGRQEVYVTTYYPDAIDLAAARPVDLGASAQVRGLEVRLHKVPVFRVSGKVVSAVTGAAGSGVVSLFRQGTVPGISARSAGVTAGDFSFDGISPGSYILETKSMGEAEDRPSLVGRQVVSVSGGDLNGVVVQLTPALEVSGNVVVEGSPPSAWPQITLTPIEGLNYPTDFATIDVNGRFIVSGLEPAPYQLNIGSISPPMFLKAIRFNGREIGNEAIDLSSGQRGSLEIVISDRASSLTGVVNDSAGPAGPGIIVTAHHRTLGRNHVTHTDESGRFSFMGLPPGEYRLIAMDIGTGFLYFPSETFEKLGKVVSLGEGVSATTELRLITNDDLQVDFR